MARSNPKSLPTKSIHSSEETDPKELSIEGKTGRVDLGLAIDNLSEIRIEG